MSALLVTPPNRPRPPTRFWLPVVLSLALHALFGLAVALVSAGGGARADGPVPVDTVVLDSGDGLIILDAPASRKGARAAPPADDEEPSEAFPATVGELPVASPTAAPPGVPAPGGSAGGEPAPGAGGGRGAGLLRPPATTRAVVYVIDRSLSMGLSGALPVAKRELLAGIDALPADARFGIILYNRQAEALSLGGETGLLPRTETNRAELARLLEGVRAEGGTDHVAALRRAVALGADIIFFVTDADEMTAEQVRSVTLLNRGRAVIHAVELNDDGARAAETPLQVLARVNGGTHRVVPVNR